MDDVIDHLADGKPLALPYAYAGHAPAESAQASPRVTEVLGAANMPHPFHPGSPLHLLRLEDGSVIAATADRVAHVDGCERCAATWSEYRSRLEDLPDGAMISAALEIETDDGPGKLLIDAEDLPPEFFEEGDDDGEG